MRTESLRTAMFQHYTQLQIWLLSRLIWYAVILYLVTLSLFALLRLFTGISIKRIGYFSLRHIVLTPRQGIEVRIGMLGISPHRPSVARPGFLTVNVSNLEIVIDPNALIRKDAESPPSNRSQEHGEKSDSGDADLEFDLEGADGLNLFPNKQSRLYKLVRWMALTIKVIDFQFHSLSLVFTDIMTIISTSIGVRVDLRKTKNYNVSNFVGTLDTYKLDDGEVPINIHLSILDVYTAESLEDESPWHALEELHFEAVGVLNIAQMCIKQMSLHFFCAQTHLVFSHFVDILNKVEHIRSSKRGSGGRAASPESLRETTERKVFITKDKERVVRFSMILLKLVHRVRIHLGIGEILKVPLDNTFFAIRMRDFSLDISRMNSLSSGFKLFFDQDDMAHQSTFTVASLTAGIDKGNVQEEILYVPLVANLTRGNLFSQTLRFVKEDKRKNDSSVRTSWVFHAPNLSIEEHNIARLVNLFLNLKKREQDAKSPSDSASNEFSADASLPDQSILPRLDCDVTVHNPGFSLICEETEDCQNSMFVMHSSRIHMALKASHDADAHSYSALATVESFGDQCFFNSGTAKKVDIANTESSSLTIKAITNPQLSLEVNGKQSNLHVKAMQHEIFCAIGQLHAAVRKSIIKRRFEDGDIPHGAIANGNSIYPEHHVVDSSDEAHELDEKVRHGSLLRSVPSWLRNISFDLSDSSLLIAANKFRGQTNELFGIRVSSSYMGVKYETGLSGESIDDDFEIMSETDGRRLRIIGSDFNLYKADRALLKRHEKNNLTDQFSVAQLPSLNLMILSHDKASVTAQLNIEPRLYIDLNVNLILAFSVVQEIIDKALLRHARLPYDLFEKKASSGQGSGHQAYEPSQSFNSSKIKRKKAKYNDSHNVTVTMPRALIKIDMPSDDQVMLELGSTTVCKLATQNPTIKTKAFRLYSQHPFKRTSWCILASMQNLNATYALDADSKTDDKIVLDVKAMRINVPYQFKLYRIIDNGITLTKAIKTLIQQTKTVDWMVVLDTKKIEGVPKIPRTRIKTQQLQLSLEDDYFESDLNLIMLTIQVVGKLRLRKVYALDARLKAMLGEGLKQLEEIENCSRLNNVDNAGDADEISADHQARGSSAGPEEKAHEKLNQAAGVFRRATQVFDLNHEHKRPHAFHDSLRSQWQSKPLAFALRNASKQKINLLLSNGLELGSPENDGDPVFTDRHVWLDFWSSREFKDFRKLKVLLQDGNPGRLTVSESRLALLQDLSDTWIKCIKRERMIQHLGAKKRRTEVLQDHFSPETCAEENIVDYSQKPLLMSVDFRQLDMTIAQTTHDTPEKLHDYIHDIGKGQPKDTEYSILIPLYVDIKAHGGLKVEVRDYPLPIMHFPGLARSQDPNNNLALQIKGDLIITEQLMTLNRSIRRIFIPLRPMSGQISEKSSDVIEVHRTLTPIKTFTDMTFHVGSTIPTRVSWCMAYKAGFHGVGEAFHGFSKPPLDPSPSLGFWDKIRLVLHARFDFKLPKSPLCLCIKAGKSPYALLNDSSGFVFAWKDNVKVEINADDNPKNLFNFRSDGFELSVPDYMEWEKEFLQASPGQRALPRSPTPEKAPVPEKVVFSFDQRTVWQLGMMFEKSSTIVDKKNSGARIKSRNTDFRDHYDVELCMPEFVDNIEKYDAYEGFKSEFMYMAISVVSRPGISEDGSVPHESYSCQNKADSTTISGGDKPNKCACHLSSGVFRHFKHWRDQFRGEQWPPIKTGSLFVDPVRERPSNINFGSALSSVQYQIALSPLDLSFFHHMRHHNASQSHDRCTGLKAKIDEFVFDWHTRREPPVVEDDYDEKHYELAGHRRWRMKSHEGEVRVSSVQMRVVDATLRTQSSKQALSALQYDDTSDSDDDHFSESSSSAEESSAYRSGSKTGTSGHGTSYMNSTHYGPKYLGHNHWVDLDDYTDVGRRRTLRSKTPDVRVLPFLYTPMFYYIRKTDFTGRAVYFDPKQNLKVQKFGKVLVHDCMISGQQPERYQADLIRLRRGYVRERLTDLMDSLESLESQGTSTKEVQHKMADLQKFIKVGEYSIGALDEEEKRLEGLAASAECCFRNMNAAMDRDLKSQMCISQDVDRAEKAEKFFSQEPEWNASLGVTDGTDYRNRYVIYAVHLRWNNSVRNLIFRLQSTLSEDKELDYVRCRRAVQYLEELVSQTEHLNSENMSQDSDLDEKTGEAEVGPNNKEISCVFGRNQSSHNKQQTKASEEFHFKESYQENSDHQKNCSGIDSDDEYNERLKTLFGDLTQVNEDTIAEKSHLVTFLTPRIQLIAEDNPSKCVQVIARDIETHIVDTYHLSESIDAESAYIERRYGILLSKSTVFVLSEEDVQHPCIDSLCLERYSGEEERNQKLWPPWLALELCYDSTPLRKFAMLRDVSFGVRLNKPNDLHVASQREGNQEGTAPTSKSSNADKDDARVMSVDLSDHETEKTSGDAFPNGEDNDTAAEGISDLKQKFSKYLKHHGEHTGEALVTSIIIDAPPLVINVDSVQFFTMYTIMVDLLTYRDPLIKKRQQAIDRAFLSNDFQGDFRATLRRIELFQKDIFTMLGLGQRLQIISDNFENNRELKIHKIQLEREVIRRMTQLTVLIRAFKASLRQQMNTGTKKYTKLSLLADSVKFRMLSETGDPTIEVILKRLHYARFSHEDSSSLNRVTLAEVLARNLLPNSTYPLILANYELEDYGNGDLNAVKVKWATLDHVGGIPVLDDTEVKLKPLHIQLEHGVFKKILDFAFPINQYSGSKGEGRHSTSSNRSATDDTAITDHDDSSDSGSDVSISLSTIERGGSEFGLGSTKTKSSKSKSRKHSFLQKLMKRKDPRKSRLDVEEMMNRASNYWSIRFLKIHPTQLTVSYKSKQHYNLLNLQNLRLPMPAIEIRNKTCTKFDLIMRLRRMAIKVLLAQSGSIVGNRFKRHKAHSLDDDRDLSLESLSRRFSRRPSNTSTVQDCPSHRKLSENGEEIFPFDHDIHFLQPLHRQKALADPENARKLIWAAITEGNSNSSYKTGKLRVCAAAPPDARLPRSSFQSLRAGSLNRHREVSGSTHAAPGSPRQLREQGARDSSAIVSQRKPEIRKHASKHHLERPPNESKHSSSFIDKLKKGFN